MRSAASGTVLGAALALLTGCADPPTPSPSSTTLASSAASASGAASAPAPRASAGATDAPPRPDITATYYLKGISTDTKRALLVEVGGPPNVLHYRVLEIDGGALVLDLPLRSLSALPLETIDDGGATRRTVDDLLADKGVADDLAKAAAVLRDFPLGAGGRVAGGSRFVAFNAGDWVYAAELDGKVKKRVTDAATYAPWFSPDGTTLYYRALTGSLDGVEGKYELFAAPADLSAPAKRVPATAAIRDGFALSADGKVARVVVSHEPVVETCVVRVDLANVAESKKETCLKDHEQLVDARLSPHGLFAVFFTSKELDEEDPGATMIMPDGSRRSMKKRAHRMRTVDLQRDEILLDVPRPPGTFLAISDAGDTVFLARERLELRQARTHAARRLARDVGFVASGAFRGTSDLVVVRGDTVELMDFAQETWLPPE